MLDIHAVCTPTEACWLNLIEAQFGVLKRFTLANTDDPDHVTRRRECTGTCDIVTGSWTGSRIRSLVYVQLALLSWTGTSRRRSAPAWF